MSGYSMHGVEEAISDGIILLGDMERMGHRLRTIQIILLFLMYDIVKHRYL